MGMLWLAVGAAHGRGEGRENLLPQLASVLRFIGDLERRLAGDGLDGLDHVHELHHRVADVLDGLAPGITAAQRTVADLVASLRAMEQALAAIRRLKSELAHET